MKIKTTPLNGLIIIEPQIFSDNRGHFFEAFQSKRYADYDIPPFVQENVSWSTNNVIRGLHYQLPYPQGKLVWASSGVIWDVVVDLRLQSPTFGKHFSTILSAENYLQLYVPPGFAHGFCVLSPEARFHYQCTEYYVPESECGIAWNDPDLNIPWPIENPILSPKDINHPFLKQIREEKLFK